MGFLEIFTRRKTPVPPRPYKDSFNPVDIYRQRYGHMRDPEMPYYTDPRFESRGKIPWFSVFGMNRDWSMTIAKLGGLFALVFVFHEYNMIRYGGESVIKMRGGVISATPNYAVEKGTDAVKTREQLGADGYAFIGTKSLDFLDTGKDDREASEKGTL